VAVIKTLLTILIGIVLNSINLNLYCERIPHCLFLLLSLSYITITFKNMLYTLPIVQKLEKSLNKTRVRVRTI